jgi:hypothetical protein
MDYARFLFRVLRGQPVLMFEHLERVRFCLATVQQPNDQDINLRDGLPSRLDLRR